jgi:hypothetical protein
MKLAEQDIEVVKPVEVLGPTSKDLGIAAKTAPFMPMRRKLFMAMDD